MQIKILNYILLLILFSLLSMVTIEEVIYNRIKRYDWTVSTEYDKANGPIHIINGKVTNKNIEIDLIQDAFSENHSGFTRPENELPVESIKLEWFSYPDNKFYKLNANVSNSKISEFLKGKNITTYDLVINFTKKAEVILYIKCENGVERDSLFVDRFRGKEYHSKWTLGENRITDVFLMNSKVLMIPELAVKSKSEFKTLELGYENNNSIGIGLLNNKFNFNNYNLKREKVNTFEIEVISKKMNEFQKLKISINYSKTEMSKILQQLSKEKVYFSMHFNQLDSIENIFIKDTLKTIQLKDYKVNYDIQEDYEKNN